MEKEQDIEKIYDLIESFDFNDLSENEKSFVLKHISLEEYNNMRSTISDTRGFLAKYPAVVKEKHSNFRKFVTYPIELYKIAAIGLLLIGIGFLFAKAGASNQKELLAIVDTVYVEKTDTMILEKIITKEIIKERVIYKDSPLNQSSRSVNYNKMETTNYKRDCSKDICPDDMNSFREIKTKGDFLNDSALKEFIVLLK